MIAEAFDSALGSFRWWRRLRGGHWERWFIDAPVGTRLWHRVERCSYDTQQRPSALARGAPDCEEYVYFESSYRPPA